MLLFPNNMEVNNMNDKKNVVQFTQKASTKELRELLIKMNEEKKNESTDNPVMQYEEWIETMDRRELLLHAKLKYFAYKEKGYDDERALWRIKKDVAELLVRILHRILIENEEGDIHDLYAQYNFIHQNPNYKFTHYITTAYAIKQVKRQKY